MFDARDQEVYEGLVIEPFAPRPGHIPSAQSLPAPPIWNVDGTYKSEDALRAMATEVLGYHHRKEIIVYCGVGGYAAGWWYVLSEILGYRKVKIYDGSVQEWAADLDAPLVVGEDPG